MMHATSSSTTTTGSSLRPPRSENGSKFRRERRRRQQQQKDSSRDNGSILWTMMLVGLLFCLIDVAYILHYVDTQHSLQHPVSSLTTSSKDNNKSGGVEHQYQQQELDQSKGAKNYRARLQKASEESGLSYEEIQVMDRQLKRHETETYNMLNNLPKKKKKKDDEPPFVFTQAEREQHRAAKKHILDMLEEAGIHDLDDRTLRDLPTWKEVTDLYGDKPRIAGLEDQCEAFQSHSDPAEHFVSTAGTFNSGTNLMAELLIANCHIAPRMKKYGAQNRGVRWQVPWGKHSPPGDEEFRLKHKTLKDANVDATNILPAVTIRDPYIWMGSMCRHEYTAHWHHDPNRHCPNLLPDEADYHQFQRFLGGRNESIPVHVKYNGFWKHHTSLAHLWNDWYREYWNITTMNRLIVRFEDLLFHPKAVTTAVCKCAGGSLKRDGKFEYVLDSAKKGPNAHGPMEARTGFLKALSKYGKADHRTDGFQPPDLAYTKQHLDPELMTYFRYIHPS